MCSPKDSGGSPTRPGSFFSLFFLILLKGLQASPVASLVRDVGQEGTDSVLGWFVLVVIIMETFAAFGSRRVHDTLLVRPCVHLVDAAFASLQPAVVRKVVVLFEYFLSDQLRHICAGMACRRIICLPTSHSSRRQIASFLRSLETVMRRALRRHCLFKSRATLVVVQFTTLLSCSLLTIILTVWLL